MVLRHVRGTVRRDLPPVVASHPDELARAGSTEAGLDGYISKQVGVDAVVARVTEIAARLPGSA
jgi:DNA-binding NarL/FixJ family response regulator